MLGAAVVVVGLAIFTGVGKAGDGNDNAPAREWAAAVLVFGAAAAVLLVLGGKGSLARKAGLYGACAGVLYGLSASLCKPTVEILGDDGLGAVVTSWEAYAFAIAGILAFVVQQLSLATGKLGVSPPSPCATRSVSIVIGTLLLDERLAPPPSHKFVAYCGLGLALVGAAVISRCDLLAMSHDLALPFIRSAPPRRLQPYRPAGSAERRPGRAPEPPPRPPPRTPSGPRRRRTSARGRA